MTLASGCTRFDVVTPGKEVFPQSSAFLPPTSQAVMTWIIDPAFRQTKSVVALYAPILIGTWCLARSALAFVFERADNPHHLDAILPTRRAAAIQRGVKGAYRLPRLGVYHSTNNLLDCGYSYSHSAKSPRIALSSAFLSIATALPCLLNKLIFLPKSCSLSKFLQDFSLIYSPS
jgi:hypothetical protein